MPLVIGTNTPSLIAQQNVYAANSRLKVSVQRLSSGFRVNSAADDAAGLARADSLRVKSRMIQAAIRNINDGFSALEVADRAAGQITDIVTRIGELAAGAAHGALDGAGRAYYNDEYNKLVMEVDRIAATSEFGGFKLLDGSIAALTIYAGFRNSLDDQISISLNSLVAAGAVDAPATAHEMVSVETVSDPAVEGGGTIAFGSSSLTASSLNQLVSLINMTSSENGVAASVAGEPGAYRLRLVSTTPGPGHDIIIGWNPSMYQNFTETPAQGAVHTDGGLSLAPDALTSAAGALAAMNAVSSALAAINTARATYGATTNRLKAALSNLQATFTGYHAAESRIRDADFASETASYSRSSIMAEAGISVLAQANSQAHNVLKLLA